MHPTDEQIYNWCNTLRKSNSGVRFAATEEAKQLKEGGYSARETLDILGSQEYDFSLAETVVAEVYAGTKRQVTASVQEVEEVSVVPTRYQDVASQVELALSELNPRQFISRLMDGQNPLIRASQKTRESLQRLATDAQASGGAALNQLHKDLKPWLEEAMLEAVLKAEKHSFQRVASKQSFDTNLSDGTCTCAKYTEGNYQIFGLACEHLVRAADTQSPHERLTRTIRK